MDSICKTWEEQLKFQSENNSMHDSLGITKAICSFHMYLIEFSIRKPIDGDALLMHETKSIDITDKLT